MKTFSSFNDFYDKALVPIAKNERHIVEQGMYKNDGIHYTHWLFALTGKPLAQNCKKYHWQATIYPSTLERQINFQFPFYESDFFDCFHQADEYLNSLIAKAREHGQIKELANDNFDQMA